MHVSYNKPWLPTCMCIVHVYTFTYLFNHIVRKVQRDLANGVDESVQTAQDYTVEVEDPGDDVITP